MTEDNEILYPKPDTNAIKADYAGTVNEAYAIIVADIPTHERAEWLGVALKRHINTVHDKLDPIIGNLNKAHKSMTGLRNDLLDQPESALKEIDRKTAHYTEEQHRIATERERQMQEAARKQEEERKLNEAIALEEEDAPPELVEEVLSEPLNVPIVHVQAAVAEIKGVSSRTVYKAEVVDLLAFVKHVASHPDDIGGLEAVMPWLNAQARSKRENLKLPGIKIVQEIQKARRV